jgi:formylglycine-generating enzyme required for sulfatase activity
MDMEMQFAWIPPGSFLMGGDKSDDERPKHRVTISKGFFLGVHPVTQAQWISVMGSNPSHFPDDEDSPVESVSWFDAMEFCKKLAEKTGKPITLPTEAEWEYACRAGTTTDYHTGDGVDALEEAGWYNGNSMESTQTVGNFEPNPWGLHDMHGNVWEWCLDGMRAYTAEPATDPKGPSGKDVRGMRGGSWRDSPLRCRAACRVRRAPSERYHYLGLRVCYRVD